MAEDDNQNPPQDPAGSAIKAAKLTPYYLSSIRFLGIWGILRRHWPVLALASLIFANGLSNILQVLLVRSFDAPKLFGLFLPLELHHWSRSLTLAFGFALIYLSLHLLQRKRVAWWVAIAVLLSAALAHVGRGNLWYNAFIPIGLLALLFVFRNRFTVRSEQITTGQSLTLLLLGPIVALAYGTLGFWLLHERDFGVNFNLGESVVRTLREFVLVGNGDLEAQTRQAQWFLQSLHVLGIVTGLFTAYSLFRPLKYRLRTLPHEIDEVRGILEKNGRSSLDYFKLWPDKAYFFSSDHSCCVAYSSSWSVAIGLGDPIGPEQGLENITKEFAQFCFDNDWSAAFHQVGPGLVPVYQKLGFDVLKIGEEAVVDLERFSAETSQNREFRRISRRFEGEGYIRERLVPPHPHGVLDEAAEVSREWLSLPGRRERRFTLGRFDRHYISGTPLYVVREPSGNIIAFANESRSYRPADATFDLMRHRLEIPNGAMDYLFHGLMLALKAEGYRTISLGLAPFAGVVDGPGASLEEQAVRQMYEHLNRFFSYKGLRNYKDKFDPNWEERYLIYQGGPLGLLRTAVALNRVTES